MAVSAQRQYPGVRTGRDGVHNWCTWHSAPILSSVSSELRRRLLLLLLPSNVVGTHLRAQTNHWQGFVDPRASNKKQIKMSIFMDNFLSSLLSLDSGLNGVLFGLGSLADGFLAQMLLILVRKH